MQDIQDKVFNLHLRKEQLPFNPREHLASKDAINAQLASFFILKRALNKHSKFIPVNLHVLAIKQHIVQVEFLY